MHRESRSQDESNTDAETDDVSCDSKPVNIFETIQGETFSETIFNINQLADNNHVMKHLLMDGFVRNPNLQISKRSKKLLTEFKQQNLKVTWLCHHEGCGEPCIGSHEISRRSVLQKIATNGKVSMLKRDFKDNVLFYRLDDENILNASKFRGYCEKHDDALFKYIDGEDSTVDKRWVNLQCLRALKRLELDIQKRIITINSLIQNYQTATREATECEHEFIEICRQQILHYRGKIARNIITLSNIAGIYAKTVVGIQSGNYYFLYEMIDSAKRGWAFSSATDFSHEKDTEPFYFFYIKVDLHDKPWFILAFNNPDLTDELNRLRSPYGIAEHLYASKEKLIFSAQFLQQLSDTETELLTRDDELYPIENDPLQQLFFSRIFFNSSKNAESE